MSLQYMALFTFLSTSCISIGINTYLFVKIVKNIFASWSESNFIGVVTKSINNWEYNFLYKK